MQKAGAGFAGFATYLDLEPSHPDMMCVPDVSSLIVLPWKKEVGWLACNPMMDGVLVDQAPRNVLNAQIKRLAEKGLTMKSGVEVEFFLLSRKGGVVIADSEDTAEKPCYDQSTLMRNYDFIAELVTYMNELGWKAYQADHEDANGQYGKLQFFVLAK
jgi:glutamine synthetase